MEAEQAEVVSPIIHLTTKKNQNDLPLQPPNPETPNKRQRVSQGRLWAGIAIPVLIVIELCAGSAGLSCAIRDAGFDACPVNQKYNKRRPHMPIANFDLSSPFGQSGLRTLQGLNKLKIETANALYDFTAVVVNRCLDRSVFFFLENPRRSLLWLLSECVAILSKPTVVVRNLQNCMFGGFRDK